MVVHRTCNAEVVGSNPTCGTICILFPRVSRQALKVTKIIGAAYVEHPQQMRVIKRSPLVRCSQISTAHLTQMGS